MNIREAVKQIPILSDVMRTILNWRRNQTFVGSDNYWEHRYQHDGTSGSGSYNRLALYKAETINTFIAEHDIQTVIEFGCGDGNQLSLMNYPYFIGLDVSSKAIELCEERFKDDNSKSFFVYHSLNFQDEDERFTAQLSLSLDVIYHLVETAIYEAYMGHLFDASQQYVIIYSSNYDAPQTNHVKHHKFTDWVTTHRPQWRLIQKMDNPYPYDPKDADNTSLADFYIYKKGT